MTYRNRAEVAVHGWKHRWMRRLERVIYRARTRQEKSCSCTTCQARRRAARLHGAYARKAARR